jgi:hypothetical protein
MCISLSFLRPSLRVNWPECAAQNKYDFTEERISLGSIFIPGDNLFGLIMCWSFSSSSASFKVISFSSNFNKSLLLSSVISSKSSCKPIRNSSLLNLF